MGSFGKCKYCGNELKSEVYKKGKCNVPRMIVFCENDNCPVKPCTDDNIPSLVMEELLYIAK